MTPSTPQPDIDALRSRIDELDQQVVRLLNERADVAAKIGQAKQVNGAAIFSSDREQRVLEQITEWGRGGQFPAATLRNIWREVMHSCRQLQGLIRVGYLGPDGSFSHLAAVKQFGRGANVEYHGAEDIAGVFEDIARDHVDVGLVPIENSNIGGISETLDGFVETQVRICAELYVHIHHNLLVSAVEKDPAQAGDSASGATPPPITRLYSKPEVFRQCRKWLSRELLEAERIAVASSSKAAELAANEPGAAALGSTLAAETYGLEVRQANIEDNPDNVTRFFVLGNQHPQPTGDDKTAIVFTTPHQSGALANVLDVLRDHGMNLTHIDKRPTKQVNWEYFFFVDFLGHESDPPVAQALDAARAKCQQLKVLGSFPRATDVL